MHEGPREDEAPLHAAGEFVGAYVGLVVEAERGEQFVRAPGGRLSTDAVISRVVDQDLPDGQEPVGVDLLRGRTQQSGGLTAAVIVPEDRESAGAGAHDVAHRADERGLPGAVRAEQAEERAIRYLQGRGRPPR